MLLNFCSLKTGQRGWGVGAGWVGGGGGKGAITLCKILSHFYAVTTDELQG